MNQLYNLNTEIKKNQVQWHITTPLESSHFFNSKNLFEFSFRFPRYFFQERFLVSIHAI